MTKHIHDLLADHPFFEGLDAAALELIGGCAKTAHFDEGEFLCREGHAAQAFCAIRQGRVAVQLSAPGRGAVTIMTLEDGDILGWSWLFPPYVWRYDVVAVESTRIVQFNGSCLRTKCDEDPALGYDLMKRFATVFAKRLEATRMQILDVYGTNPTQ